MNLVSQHEQRLFVVSLVVSGLIWLLLFVATLGTILLYVLLIFIAYLFAQSAFIARLKGNGICVSASQYPHIHQALIAACERIGQTKIPTAYVLRSNALHALATRFLTRHYIVLHSQLLEEINDNSDALAFYIGQQLGHVQRNHHVWKWFLFPASIVPILGFAYRRAQVYSCDLYGVACSQTTETALNALALQASGYSQTAKLNRASFIEQSQDSSGFWMSLHELTSDQPWLSKRMAHIQNLATNTVSPLPRRHWLATIVALFIPRLGVQGSVSVVLFIALFGLLAALFSVHLKGLMFSRDIGYSDAYEASMPITVKIEQYLEEYNAWPTTMMDLGYNDYFVENESPNFVAYLHHEGAFGVEIAVQIGFDLDNLPMLLVYIPKMNGGQLVWHCRYVNVDMPELLPKLCQIEYGEQ